MSNLTSATNKKKSIKRIVIICGIAFALVIYYIVGLYIVKDQFGTSTPIRTTVGFILLDLTDADHIIVQDEPRAMITSTEEAFIEYMGELGYYLEKEEKFTYIFFNGKDHVSVERYSYHSLVWIWH